MITIRLALLVLGICQDATGDGNTAKLIESRDVTSQKLILSSIKNCEEQNDVRFLTGFQLLTDEKHELALLHFEQMISQKPMMPSGYIGRGLTYSAKGDQVLAIKSFAHAIELKPDSKLARRSRGFSYIQLNHYDDAIRDGEHLLRIDKTDTVGYSIVALSLQQKDLYRLAIIVLDAGIDECDDECDDDGPLRFLKAACCLHVKAYETARSEVQVLLQYDPTDKAVKILADTIESLIKQNKKSGTNVDR